MSTVLIVDDEKGFCQSISALLRRRGFQTFEADSADAAMALLAASEIGIDVVLTDVVMPFTTGLMLADRAKVRHPDIKFLFMSGYPLPTLEREFGLSRELMPGFLQKPFLADAVVARIREVLGVSESVL
jgi:DNA-binding NtrC family response regulator